MPRSASVACIARLVVAVAAAAAGCGGKVVHLGCPHAQVKANEVLWIGDSWMLVPASSAPMRVQDLARAAGAIGADILDGRMLAGLAVGGKRLNSRTIGVLRPEPPPRQRRR